MPVDRANPKGGELMAPMNHDVYLENAGGVRIPLHVTCSIGRAPGNTIILGDSRVSRRHAIIQPQNTDEYWLVDFGSINGTFVNGRRVTLPILLKDKFKIQIVDTQFTFHQEDTCVITYGADGSAGNTLCELWTAPFWLLLADIHNSTALMRKLSATEIPIVFGEWFAHCRQLIIDHGGVIDKFLGDGFLAYWPDMPDMATKITEALAQLKLFQEEKQPAFRIVLHYGMISLGGNSEPGRVSLLGEEVNFAFRMEKLAGKLKVDRLLSEAAAKQIQSHLPSQTQGNHALAGFEGTFCFYTI